MGRYGGHECGKCGGSHRGVCPAYYDETEAMIDEERRQGRVCRCGDPACPHKASCYSFVKKQEPTSLADAMGVQPSASIELFINDGTTPLWGDVDPEKDFEDMMKEIQTFFRANAGPVFTHERVDRMMVAIADEVEDHRFHHDSPPEMLDLLLHFVANSRGCEEETDR